MNLPNKLTVGRIFLVPFFVAAMLINFPCNNIAAIIIFVIASVTDMMDGKIARKNNLITDFGKFADPLADKILVLSALLCFVQKGLCGSMPVIIVLFREFTVTSIRLIAASKGKVVAANIWGKVKTVSQMIAIIAILLMQFVLSLPDLGVAFDANVYLAIANAVPIISEILVWISTVFAIISGVIYVYQNRQFIEDM